MTKASKKFGKAINVLIAFGKYNVLIKCVHIAYNIPN